MSQRVAKLTKWKEISALDFYLAARDQDKNAKWCDINECPICKCELFEVEVTADEKDDKDDGKQDDEKEFEKLHQATLSKLKEMK